jgi:hypothetical protein
MILCRFKVCGVHPTTKLTNESLRWNNSLNLAPAKQSQRLHVVDLNKDREQGVQNARLDIFSLPSSGGSDRRIQLSPISKCIEWTLNSNAYLFFQARNLITLLLLGGRCKQSLR